MTRMFKVLLKEKEITSEIDGLTQI